VEFENQHIRVLRFRLGPREKSPMHEHPARITTNLTSGRSRVTLGDGRSQEMESRAGEVAWRPAIRHAVENLTDKPLEIVTTELKPEPPHAAEVASRAKTVSKAKSTVRKKPAVKRVVKKAARRHRARKQGR
jgi:quercetin dioxygenase-like cupin family protein